MKFFVEQALFEPTAAAAQARLQAFHPYQYAQSRNHLDGAVSMLSPYLTHGFLTVPEVAAHVYRVHRMSVQHKFIFELAWREYFLHVHDAIGDDVYQDIHQGVLPADAYTNNLPEDVRQGSTGVPAIDQSVRQLYFNGYLHNHARLWVASYLVHIRKVHWRAGADWMYSHLLDGDIASNHLSWQWVAGTGSSKPYLFNAANVALHAPESWHSPNTVIDKSMDIIEMISQSQATFTQKIVHHIKVDEPDLLDKPPPEAGLVASGLAADKLIDRDVWWIHPWSLSEQAPPKLPADAMRVAACWLEWTQAHPWNTARWLFVARGMHQVASHCWFEDAARLCEIFCKARSVHVWDHRALPNWPGVHWVRHPAPRLWPRQTERSPSFSHWWSKVTRYKQSIPQLLRKLQES